MKTVGILWMNSMAGWSAMANSRKKTTVEEHDRDKAIRAPKRSANLPTRQKPKTTGFLPDKNSVSCYWPMKYETYHVHHASL